MNGNWGGIASRDFERIRDDHNDYDPSLDVINTIVSLSLTNFVISSIDYSTIFLSIKIIITFFQIASYAASNVDESEQKDNPPVKSKREQNYYYDDQQGQPGVN